MQCSPHYNLIAHSFGKEVVFMSGQSEAHQYEQSIMKTIRLSRFYYKI